MGGFISYTIIASAAMLVMVAVYRLTVASEKQPAFNRATLLAIYVLAFIAPAIGGLFRVENGNSLSVTVLNLQTTSEHPVPTTVTWQRIAIWVYLVGAVWMLLRTAAVWIRLWHMVRSARVRQRIGDYTLAVTDYQGYTPFSWLRYIVMSKEDYDSDSAMIITHEKKHLELGHPIDMIVAQIAVIALWYTPAPYLMRAQLRAVHEYQADMAVVDSGIDMRTYQLMLLRKVAGKSVSALANSLNHSKLKQRINMMHKSEAAKSRRMRALAIAPALLLAIAAVSTPSVANALQSIASTEIMSKSESTKSNDADENVTIITVDGRQISEQEMNAIDPTTIKSIDVSANTNPKRISVTLKTPKETTASTPSADTGEIKIVSTSSVAKDSSTVVINTAVAIEKGEVVVEVDGRIVTPDEFKAIDPDKVASVTVMKTEPARIVIKLKP